MSKKDKEAQVYKCLICDEQEVRWDGKQWVCSSCKAIAGLEEDGIP